MKLGIIIGVLLVAVLVASILIVKVFMPRQIVKVLEQYGNALTHRQFEEIRNTYREMRGWRHDYKNHMQVLKGYVEQQQWQECLDYILQMNQDLSNVDHVIKTGNVMADAIVNSKVSLAKTKNIQMDVTAKIPENLPVSDVEFCVLFGNLMDNAIEACEKIASTEDRFIRVYIGMFKKQFYISVTNATNHKSRVKKYYSLKGEGHGFGLCRIDKIIKERNGYVNRKDEPGVFATEIM
ncbi:MAG: GHKL domain-containing protein, partial [Eubacteriales bacterium]|nr:GHKL domain-containing protein [Eubacteriales bacterium]